MSVDIRDIMKLTELNGAVIVAGERGADNVVHAIGIIDHFDPDYNYHNLFPNSEFLMGEIMLSGHFVRLPVEVQCEGIRFMHRVGASGIIIYHVGLFAERIESEVIDVANELSFPIIQLPTNRRSYSDIIMPVSRAIMAERGDRYYLPGIVLEKLAGLPETQRTIDNLIRIISSYTHLSVALYDRQFNSLYEHTWMEQDKPLFKEADFVRQLPPGPEDRNAFVNERGDTFYYLVKPVFFSDDLIKHIAVVSEYGPVETEQLERVLDSIRLYFMIWHGERHGLGALARSIAKSEVVKSRRLSKIMGVELDNIQLMFICTAKNDMSEKLAESCISGIERFFDELHMRPIYDRIDNAIVVFLEKPAYHIRLEELSASFEEAVSVNRDELLIFCHCAPSVSAEAKELYQDFMEHISYLRKIYPARAVVNGQELTFAKECAELIKKGRESLNRAILILEALGAEGGRQKELQLTLAAFLLDCDGSIDKTAEAMYVHKSTVKYRLKRINEMLGYDVKKMPESYQLYRALAVTRLLD